MSSESVRGNRLQRCTIPLFDLLFGGGEVHTIERFVSEVPGVKWAYANSATEMVYVAFDPTECDPTEIVRAIERAGFRAGDPIMRG